MEQEVHSLGPRITLFVLIVNVIALVLFDVFMGMTFGREATITCVIREHGRWCLAIVFAFGFVAGHLFWP